MSSSTTRSGGGADDGRSEREEPAVTPAEQRLRELLTTLVERTRDESVNWQVDDARVDSYCLVGAGWMLATRSTDGDGVAPHALLITDAEGRELVEIRSTSPFGRPLAQTFAELHAAASASALLSASTPTLARILDEVRSPGGDLPPPD